MKRTFLVTLAAVAVLTMGLQAQDASFDGLYSSLLQPAVSAPDAPAPAAADSQPQAAAPVEREWLVMVFINGVNDLGLLGLADKNINDMEKAGSTDRVAVVVEYSIMGQDGSAARNLQFQRGSKTIYVTRDEDASKINSPVIYASSDADMGSEAGFARFIKRAARRFPARKTAVIIWNHGAGRLGISFDDVSGNHMEVDKLGRALGQIKRGLGKKIDVLATDACFMQMAGVVYEFKDYAEVVVGSEEIVPVRGYPYTAILNQLSADPGMGAETLGRVMVDAYGASYKKDATLSALRTAALPGFVEALNNWVAAVKADRGAFAAATSASLAASASQFSQRDSKDLIDYLERVEAVLGPSSLRVKDSGAVLRDYISSRLVISNTAKPSFFRPYTQAKGLAIYMPDFRYDSANYEKLSFARDSLWDDFLRDMMEERLKP